MKKILNISILSILFVFLLTIPCYATLEFNSIQAQVNMLESTNMTATTGIVNTGEMEYLIDGISNVLTTVGVIAILAGLLITGINYMVATPDNAARLKGRLIGLLVSAIVLIGAFGIWKIAGTIFKNLSGADIRPMPLVTPTPTPEPIEPISIKFIQDEITLKTGNSTTVKVEINPRNADSKTYITYYTEDYNIALVDEKGRITAINPGTTYIVATTANGKTARLKVIAELETDDPTPTP